MDFIRNKEVKRQIVVSSILILFWGGIGIIVDSKAVWIVLSAVLFLMYVLLNFVGYIFFSKREFLQMSFRRE